MTDTPSSRGSRAAPPVVNLGDPLPLADRADNRVLIPALEGAPPRPPSDVIRALGGQTMGTSWNARVIAPPGVGEDDIRALLAPLPEAKDNGPRKRSRTKGRSD